MEGGFAVDDGWSEGKADSEERKGFEEGEEGKSRRGTAAEGEVLEGGKGGEGVGTPVSFRRRFGEIEFEGV